MLTPQMITALTPPQVPFHFRLIQPSDFASLHDNCYPHFNATRMQALLKRSAARQMNGRSHHLVATDQDTVIGSGQLIRLGQGAEIAELVVARAHRSRGIGTTMIRILEAYASKLGWHPIEIGVNITNRRALALYQRLGYYEHKRLQLERGDVALILRRRDSHSLLK